ncbi:MAG: 50S ribosomal protein L25 [Calditrichia bacterium]
MSEVNVLKAKKREQFGKSATRKYRLEGWVPAEYYSSHDDNMHLLFDQKLVEQSLANAHGLLTVQVEGSKKKHACVLKDLQVDPLRGNVIHVDLQGIRKGEKISLTVPVVLHGTAAGVKTGGILEHLVREIDIECLPKDIPEQFDIDISAMEIGDSVHVRDLQKENVRILADPDETILILDHPRMAVEEEEVEEEEELTEPEVITSRREEEEDEE